MVLDATTGKQNGDLVLGLCAKALPTSANGRSLFRPLQIVSLADVNKILPFHMFDDLTKLRKIEGVLAVTIPASGPVLEETKSVLFVLIKNIREGFADPLELPFTGHLGKRTKHLVVRLNGNAQDEGGLSNAAVWGDVRALRESLESTLEEHLFLCMSEEEARLYEQPALFGERVANQFPEANKEITNAGSCYAAGSYTACVFHLTRAVEICARVLVSALGMTREVKNHAQKTIPVKLADWNQLLTALEKGVTAKQSGISTSATKRETYEFYNHAVSQFRSFKDAWRNKVSHKRKTYKAGEARDIMDNVKQFIVHVSQRLKEPKGATFE